jgi:catechol 2,3-dioxygenase-like lactoylglutathione lyase family enzyme
VVARRPVDLDRFAIFLHDHFPDLAVRVAEELIVRADVLRRHLVPSERTLVTGVSAECGNVLQSPVMKRRLTLVLSGALLGTLSAQSPDTRADSPPFTATPGVFMALSVANLGASVQWYSEKLGLKVTEQEPKRDRVAFALLEGGGLMVELIQHDDAQPLSKAPPASADRHLVHGLFKAGLVVDDFDGVVARLKARGVEIAYGPFSAQPHKRANVIIRDNAGNLIQFFGSPR